MSTRKQPHELAADDLITLDGAHARVLSITTHHPHHPRGRVAPRVHNRLGDVFDLGIPAPVRVFDSADEARREANRKDNES